MTFSRIQNGCYQYQDATGTFATVTRLGPPSFIDSMPYIVSFGGWLPDYLVEGGLRAASDFVRAEFAHQQASA